jgi:hypothetical protein
VRIAGVPLLSQPAKGGLQGRELNAQKGAGAPGAEAGVVGHRDFPDHLVRRRDKPQEARVKAEFGAGP